MSNLKQLKDSIINQFAAKLHETSINTDFLTKSTLELKLNTIIEDIIEKIDLEEAITIPLKTTTTDNIFDGVDLGIEKSKEVELPFDAPSTKEAKNTIATTIDENFKLTYEMEQYAKSKYMIDPVAIFEEFKLYHQSQGTLSKDWNAMWKLYVSKQNRFANHIIKTTIDENMQMDQTMYSFAKKYIDKNDIETEFLKFKNHYISTGDIKVSWVKTWENWCLNHKNFKPFKYKEQTQAQQEKASYKWDFKKAKETSDKIKNWLEFEKKINWMEDFYLKDIPIPGIGWQEVQHPDFNKEEILLYKIQSENGQFMLERRSDEILEVEILENDKNPN
ncbi:MAG: hypothetical protein IE909_06690 [Campylobacterales bacterium]|nr:hypothetical protein [Campylobacterales bacterium]